MATKRPRASPPVRLVPVPEADWAKIEDQILAPFEAAIREQLGSRAEATLEEPFVVGINQYDRLVIAPRSVAIERADLWEALRTSETWADFEDAITPEQFAEAVERLSEGANVGVDDLREREFDADEIAGYADGDWPPLLECEMEEWLPASIEKRFGRRGSNTLRQQWLELDADFDELVAALRKLGYEIEEAFELIERASGGGFYC